MSDFFYEKIRNPLVFFSILLLIFIFAICIILPTKSFYEKKFEKNVLNFLNINFPQRFSLEKRYFINQVSDGNQIYAWNIKDTKNEGNKIYIIRVTGICGPLTLAFLHNNKTTITKCLGVIGIKKDVSLEKLGVTPIILKRWSNTISKLEKGINNEK
ncbi:MAG: hypothetical protein GX220_05335 [Treponema sp.]|nr:hypothetical protein [Treponema sp.]